MKKKMLTLLGVAAMIMALVGCSSVQTASTFGDQEVVTSGKPVAHVSATNWGLYFLCWPLVTGSDETPGCITFLEDTATATRVSKMVAAKAKELEGTKLIDLVTETSAVGLLFNIHSASASATVVK